MTQVTKMETFGLSTLLDCHGRNFLASHYFSEYLYLKRLYENAHNYIISGYNLLASNWLPSMPDLMELLQFHSGGNRRRRRLLQRHHHHVHAFPRVSEVASAVDFGPLSDSLSLFRKLIVPLKASIKKPVII